MNERQQTKTEIETQQGSGSPGSKNEHLHDLQRHDPETRLPTMRPEIYGEIIPTPAGVSGTHGLIFAHCDIDDPPPYELWAPTPEQIREFTAIIRAEWDTDDKQLLQSADVINSE